MMNRLVRPCTLWGQAFDAVDVLGVWYHHALGAGTHFSAITLRDLEKGKYAQRQILSPSFDSEEKGRLMTLEAITTIAKALNPYIWVMDAVLDAVKKEPNAKYLILDKRDSPYFELALDVDEIKRGDYIQADCPLALKVLLQFTLDGTPVKEKETK